MMQHDYLAVLWLSTAVCTLLMRSYRGAMASNIFPDPSWYSPPPCFSDCCPPYITANAKHASKAVNAADTKLQDAMWILMHSSSRYLIPRARKKERVQPCCVQCSATVLAYFSSVVAQLKISRPLSPSWNRNRSLQGEHRRF